MMAAAKIKPHRVGFYQYQDIILGKGNFATVYLAHHKIIGCDVALKVINTDDIEEEYVSKNLSREARILKDLHHPNIIRLYETVTTVNLYCLSLELIRGVNLFQFMKQQESKRISEKLARIFFYQMLSAVEYMHRLHIIHRDLKQENILVEFGHHVKIVDFGLSNVYYPCHRPRTHCGSVEYAAPELFRPHSVYGSAADLWSLGVILYAMVVGKLPFVYDKNPEEDPESAYKRELFVKRISKGLMQENWELMEDLSPDCWNLLHDLLQPDQFRRIRVEEAITHHWITKDMYLKKRLPQKRRDLQRKFHYDIVEYLANKLRVTRSRVEKHLGSYRHDKIACMYYIMRDTLIKEVLHPPKDFEASFLFRFDCWRQGRQVLLPLKDKAESDKKVLKDDKNEEAEDAASYVLKNTDKELLPKAEKKILQRPSHAKDNKIKTMEDSKQAPDSGKQNRSISTCCRGKQMLSSKRIPSDFDNNATETAKGKQKNLITPYKSYKSSRPERRKECPTTQVAGNKLSDIKEISTDSLQPEKNMERKKQLHTMQKESTNPNSMRKKYIESYSGISFISHVEKLSLESIPKSRGKLTFGKSSKCTDGNDRKTTEMKHSAKHDSKLKSSISDLKNFFKKQTVVAHKVIKNSNLREISCQTTEEYKSKVVKKREYAEKGNTGGNNSKIYIGTPSKIPVKNMRYGPPAAFAQSPKILKSKKTTVADRISLCRGDTNEK